MHYILLFGYWYANDKGNVLLKKRPLEKSFQRVRIYLGFDRFLEKVEVL